jgi:hypothetical protein
MILRNRLNGRSALRSLGLVCLILASLSHLFLHPTAGFGPGLVDGTTGLLYGVSIGSLLLSLRSHRWCSRENA